MPIDMLTNNDIFKAVASIITGGAFVGWYRERRRGKKDAQSFALEFMREQSSRIDTLVGEVAQLKAESKMAHEALDIARNELHSLRGDLFKARLELDQKNHEITRLKTALGEHNDRRGAA